MDSRASPVPPSLQLNVIIYAFTGLASALAAEEQQKYGGSFRRTILKSLWFKAQ